MQKLLLVTSLVMLSFLPVSALTISEIMSNPTGDDSGREWVELYNEGDQPVDISSLAISVKGGAFAPASPVVGGSIIVPHGYAIIGSVVSGATKFLVDYPSYEGVLFKSSIGLVNTGVTSLDMRIGGVVVASLSSYSAAKEGYTYSLLGGSYDSGIPTPGKDNQLSAQQDASSIATSTSNGNQATYLQASVPTADIVLYLPSEKTVIAGAPSSFSTFGLTHAGKAIDTISYTWSFGDGGMGTGSSTVYRYFYPGTYTATIEGSNGQVLGVGSMKVRVVAPDISISSLQKGKYGTYLVLTNPNDYDLDISLWKVSINGAGFSFPKNTLIRRGSTIIPSQSLGFASTTYSSSTVVALLFPNMEEVTRAYQDEAFYHSEHDTFPVFGVFQERKEASIVAASSSKDTLQKTGKSAQATIKTATKGTLSSKSAPLGLEKKDTTTQPHQEKDTRIASWLRSFFGR